MNEIISDVELFKVPLYKVFFTEEQTNLEYALMIGGSSVMMAFMAPYIVSGVISFVGFQAGGIATGSLASWIMSFYSGAVTSGSACAILQSIGAAGLSSAGMVTSRVAGAAVVGGISLGLEKFFEKNKLSESEESSLDEFLKVRQSKFFYGSNTIIFDFNTLIRQNEEYVDKFIDVLIVVSPFTKTKMFKVNNCDKSCTRIIERLSKTYGDSRVNYFYKYKSFKYVHLDLSTFEHPEALQKISGMYMNDNQKIDP